MPLKRRKIDTETKEVDSSSSAETPAVEVEVKTERLSQDDEEDHKKDTVTQQLKEEKEKPTTGAARRTLRPRKPLPPSSRSGKKGIPQKGTVNDKASDSGKPKPKKRIRSRKPAVVKPEPAITTEEKILEDKSDPLPEDKSRVEHVEKNDVICPAASTETKEKEVDSSSSAETPAVKVEVKTEHFSQDEEKDQKKDAAAQKLKKEKPTKVASKTKRPKKPISSSSSLAAEKEIPVDNQPDKPIDVEKPKPKKRIRNRKPVVKTEPAITTEDKSLEEKSDPPPDDDKRGPEQVEKSSLAGRKKISQKGTADDKPMDPEKPKPKRRFRNRKPTEKPAVTTVENKFDPLSEDIRGFEHVKKYVTPPGVRLPKFWDSEDEMSEDENNDNFRRIMCGFGTNCRIHEVIRPASEIVRRLKELQNTFGATKSLPLFQKNDLEFMEETRISPSTEAFFRKDRERTITWHTDPSFFKYANNYPSRCK